MICDVIKSLREKAGISQTALSKRIGVTRAAVNAWEMGLSMPTAQYIVEMSQLFHVSADYILGLERKEAIYLDGLGDREKKLLYDMYDYFSQE